MKKYTSMLLGALVALVVLAASSLYIVDQRQLAILFQLGEVVDVKTSPGLYFKIPLAQNVRYFDSRILTMDTTEPERFITSEKKNVLVDLFVKWRIVDVKQYYVSVRGDEMLAQTRLAQTVNSSLRDEFGNRTVHDVVSGERDQIMEIMRQKADADARKIGVEVVDVRLKRVDLPQEVSESVYRRMEAERKRVANELRSTGSAESETPTLTASAKSFLPKLIGRPRKQRVRAMQRPQRSMPLLFSQIRNSMPFIVAWKPINRASKTRTTCWFLSLAPNSSSI